MSHLTQPRVARPFVSATLLGCLLFASLWLAGHAGAQAETTPTSPPTPTPTPSPPDAALAATFARDGKLDEAIGAYLAVIGQGASEERLAARLALARIYLDDGQARAAVRQLDAYLLEAPLDADVRAAQFLLAEALSLEQDWGGALPLYDAYIQAGGAAPVYARLGRAEALARVGRSSEAVSEAEALLDEDLPPSIRLSFILTIAGALEASQPQEALAWYDRLGRESDAPADDALALWRSALITGDVAVWVTIIQRYPESPTAQEIIDDPPSTIHIALDSYYRGLVYYRAGRDREAREAFEQSLRANERDGDRALAARSAYYLAVMDEGDGDLDAAIAGYGRVPQLDPRGKQADDALWWRGRLLEQEERVGEATASYQRLLSEFESSDWAAEARFRLALLDYDAGRFDEAAEAFAAIADDEHDGEQQRALLWQGKALAGTGDDEAAEVVWRKLRQDAPAGYYGLRAAVLSGEASGRLEDAGLPRERGPDWAGIEAWLRESGEGDPSLVLSALLFNRHWALGQELLALGMDRRANAEFELLIEAAGDDPIDLYHIARFGHSAGLAHLSSRAAARLLNAVPEEQAEVAPAGLWRLAYPAPYVDVVREVADEEDVPDLLLLAVVRQESFFDPLAGSSAGALGLTQVIPATGEAIARDLALAGFRMEDLYRPAASLRFGAHYLLQQLDAFNGNVYHALAAYNGGPGNAARWRDGAGADVDRFAEEIDFSQTRAYLHLVLENLARYRQLYEGLEAPALPED